MSGCCGIPGGPGFGVIGHAAAAGNAGDAGTPGVRPSAGGPQPQPPQGLAGSRTASGGRPAPRGNASPGGAPATLLSAPMPVHMEDRRGSAVPAGASSLPPGRPLQLHAAQQLILAGDIQGNHSACKAEAERRVRDVQDKVHSLADPPINWADAVVELRELPSESKITENTFLQLADAAHKSYKEDRA